MPSEDLKAIAAWEETLFGVFGDNRMEDDLLFGVPHDFMVVFVAHILSDESFIGEIRFQSLQRFGGTPLDLSKPCKCDPSGEEVPTVTCIKLVNILLSACKQCDIEGSDHPGLSFRRPTDLSTFSVELTSKHKLDLRPLHERFSHWR